MGSHRTEMCRATDGQGGSCTLIGGHDGDHQFFNWQRFREPPTYIPQSYILAAHAALDAIEAEAAFGRDWVWFSRERWEALKAAVLALVPGLAKDDTRANEHTEGR